MNTVTQHPETRRRCFLLSPGPPWSNSQHCRRHLLTLFAVTLLTSGTVGAQPVILPGQSSAGNLSPADSAPASHSAVSQSNDRWYLVEFDGRRVGYEHVTSTRTTSTAAKRLSETSSALTKRTDAADSGPQAIRRFRETRLEIRRFGKDMSLTAIQETVETTEGLLMEWSLRRTAADGGAVERSGIWNPEISAYDVTERMQATRRAFRLAAGQQPRSAIISEWAPAMVTGSRRRFRSPVLFPETSAVVEVSIESAGSESRRLRDGSTASVNRVSFWPLTEPASKTILFVDSGGNVIRSEQLLLGEMLSMELCDAATALGGVSLESLDLELASAIPVRRPISNPTLRSETRLRIRTGPGELLTLPEGRFQKVSTISGNETIVTLLKPSPTSSSQPETFRGNSEENQAAGEYLARTHWTATDSPLVERMARSAAGGTAIPGETCRRLTQHLFTRMKRTPFSTSLLPADEAAKQMRGDCTEHAVLLASLMRVCRIPSRVIAGFVYSERVSGFVPHMWTEALIDGEWIPFDSTVGPDGISATYLRVAESSLADDVTSGTLIFLPLLNLMGRAQIDVLTESGF